MAVTAYSPAGRFGNDTVAEINVTPLVDVMLVLLIIFMVTAPAVTGQLKLSLPVPTPAPEWTPPKAELNVQQDGSFVLDGRALTRTQLSTALTALAAENPETVLTVDANADADYQAFAQALAAADEAGIRNLSTK
ncbi:transport energizing protein, ExbD/TolR family [Lysobacter enzymogenes]|uniref:Transport energizing protein, ExbD/TolR family n=1 Tax=Lysobacter enzymogenes TaxID=69 RepID=A0A0S2DQ71_LYSEN|nr:biopolymer transporter ExbD [Lysobacter enzymogenes]ALN60668.1 transport energizing protein, ExbD/TolR family [Lysobacter enzymogenes]QCW28543.1 biopolymer transporter ExbD [Lysobacter enzymogenes]